MKEQRPDDGSKKAKNIAAVVYLLVLIFLVGGSYINQRRDNGGMGTQANAAKP